MRLARQINAAILFASEHPFIEKPEWTETDAKGLHNFLTSEVGKRWLAYKRAMLQAKQSDAMGTFNDKPLTVSCGWCNGLKDSIVTDLALADIEHFTDNVSAEDSYVVRE